MDLTDCVYTTAGRRARTVGSTRGQNLVPRTSTFQRARMVSCSSNQPETVQLRKSNTMMHWLGWCSRRGQVERQRHDQRQREDMLRSEVDRSTRQLHSSCTSPLSTTCTQGDQPREQLRQGWANSNRGNSPTQSFAMANTNGDEHNHVRFSANTGTTTSMPHERPTDVLQLLRIKRPTASTTIVSETRAEENPILSSHPRVSTFTGGNATAELAPRPSHPNNELSDLMRSVDASLARAAHARAIAAGGST